MPSTSLSEAPSSDESVLITTSGQNSSTLNKDLAALRAVTAPFHNFEKALAAGYDDELTPCLKDPMLGGQGFHYGNLGLFDDNVELLRPETLLYEPHGGGSMRLVAVEYIVPLDAWDGADPPHLLGRDFHVNAAAGIYALHVWLWRTNPSGLFADWNPRVSCSHPSS